MYKSGQVPVLLRVHHKHFFLFTKDIYSTSYPKRYTMVIVAVVGGTGNVGKTLVDALKENGKYEVIVFARKVSSCVVANDVSDLVADR